MLNEFPLVLTLTLGVVFIKVKWLKERKKGLTSIFMIYFVNFLFSLCFKMSLQQFMLIVLLQFVVSVFVLRLFLRETRNTKYIVAAGLAQVSEFSFVLGSRARRFHLISREVNFRNPALNYNGVQYL